MNEREMEIFSDAMTSCAFSEDGCNRLPVRLIMELPVDPTEIADATIVLLCLVHVSDYEANGEVVQDQRLPTADLPEEVLLANPARADYLRAEQIIKQDRKRGH